MQDTKKLIKTIKRQIKDRERELEKDNSTLIKIKRRIKLFEQDLAVLKKKNSKRSKCLEIEGSINSLSNSKEKLRERIDKKTKRLEGHYLTCRTLLRHSNDVNDLYTQYGLSVKDSNRINQRCIKVIRDTCTAFPFADLRKRKAEITKKGTTKMAHALLTVQKKEFDKLNELQFNGILKILNEFDIKAIEQSIKKQEARFKDIPLDIEDVPWAILPPGTLQWSELKTYLADIFDSEKVQRDDAKIAEERFKKIVELKPDKIYRGRNTFSEYLALVFIGHKKVVLESVRYGNAIYVVDADDWRTLSQLTKTDLSKRLSNPEKDRIAHDKQGKWFFNLKNWHQIGFE